MANPALQTEDAVVQSVLATLDTHIQAMYQAGRNVEAIKEEIQQHFKAAASTAYQAKIDDWSARYTQLQQAYDHFKEALAKGHQQINNAHQEALGVGGNWNTGPSSVVYNGLNPS
ncbi:hypothetical protein [Kitasatospora sp. NPDC097643]|uniref:WXG100 family type VII secretion target n=1 Tax=Kitasatospora sp. NPDC097643 TaxID=3157230 RepID=UPI00331F11EF